ncbi:MAG TPA: TRAP transporter substrate-binding protein DctP [Polyangia bacterium]|jgi:TRAP-type C4-dicarboxylate transport system substrate-binding protein|nr:TRAP transporter substrate-binding protein DctP [Polyangia bacterium]
MTTVATRAACALGPVVVWVALVVGCGGFGGSARAEPVTLRMSSITPEGTAWARDLRAFAREVETETRGNVRIKWYLGGIAGDEMAQHERVQRDQLDGVVSGGMLCEKLAPSLRAVAMAGQLRDRDEADFVVNRLRSTLDDEMARAGYVNLSESGMGFSLVFSKTPVRTLSDLQQLRPWLWVDDESLARQLSFLGMHPVPLPIEAAGSAYDAGKVDGFIAIPSAALAFQWSTQARYVTELRIGYLVGCMLVARKAWDPIAAEDRAIMLTAAAKMRIRMEGTIKRMDATLVNGLFAKQGMTTVPVTRDLQSEFLQRARTSQKVVQQMVPPGVLDRMAGWLADYRQHRAPHP